MAITQVGSGTTHGTTATQTHAPSSMPAGILGGDLIVVMLSHSGDAFQPGTATLTGLDGYTQAYAYVATAQYAPRLTCVWKIAPGDSPPAPNLQFSASTDSYSVTTVWRGVDTGDPFTVGTGAWLWVAEGTGTTNLIVPGCTLPVVDMMKLTHFAEGGLSAATTPSGWAIAGSAIPNFQGGIVYSDTDPNVGTAAQATVVAAEDDTNFSGIMVALRPLAGSAISGTITNWAGAVNGTIVAPGPGTDPNNLGTGYFVTNPGQNGTVEADLDMPIPVGETLTSINYAINAKVLADYEPGESAQWKVRIFEANGTTGLTDQMTFATIPHTGTTPAVYSGQFSGILKTGDTNAWANAIIRFSSTNLLP